MERAATKFSMVAIWLWICKRQPLGVWQGLGEQSMSLANRVLGSVRAVCDSGSESASSDAILLLLHVRAEHERCWCAEHEHVCRA